MKAIKSPQHWSAAGVMRLTVKMPIQGPNHIVAAIVDYFQWLSMGCGLRSMPYSTQGSFYPCH